MATHRSLHRPLALLAPSISILKMNSREGGAFPSVHPTFIRLLMLQNTQLASVKAGFLNPLQGTTGQVFGQVW